MERDENALRELIRKSGFGTMEDALMQFAVTSIHVITTRVDDEDELAIGQSKIGGHPDLPTSIAWPTSAHAKSLPFVGQFDMREVSAFDHEKKLPTTGWMYFFGDPWLQQFRGQVFYFDGDLSELERNPFPDDIPPTPPMEWGERFNPCKLTLMSEINLSNEAYELDEQISSVMPDKTWQDLHAVVRQSNYPVQFVVNRLLGTPYGGDADMQRQSQLIADTGSPYDPTPEERERAENLKHEWQLLLQVGSDDNAGMMWSDMGTIFFYIRQTDLASRHFDDVCLLAVSG